MKFILKIGLILTLLNPFALALHAQSDDPQAVVLQAIANLEDGYVFTGTSDLAQTFTDDENTYTSFNSQIIAGTIAANGDYHFSTATRTAATLPELETLPPFLMDLIWVDDRLSVEFDIAGTPYEEQFPELTPNWHDYESLLAEIDDPVRKQVLESLVNVPTPSQLLLNGSLIESVTEQESETVDGVVLRVFAVEMDALEIFASQSPPMSLEELLRNASLITASEFDLTYTLYIGAEDGQLYRVVGAGRSFLPYFTEEADGLPYDLESVSTIGFELSQHGDAGTISLLTSS